MHLKDKMKKTSNKKAKKSRKNFLNVQNIENNIKMQFCPKDGLLLVQKRTRFVCSKCGYAAKGKVKIFSSEKIAEKKKIGAIKEKDTNVWPVTSTTCPKCGNSKAYFWSAQLRANDEAETQFFKCTKCKHIWRIYR